MYNYLAVLLLAAAAWGRNITNEELISLFGSPDQPLQTGDAGPASVAQSPVIEETINKSCIAKTGVQGICVNYYLCHNNSIITDGEGVLEDRFKGVCDVGELCCVLPDARTPDHPVTLPTPTIQNNRTGCGWRNEGGLAPRFSELLKEEAQVTEFPWMVALFTIESLENLRENDKVYIGGGSLIHPSVVLTAAHKVHDLWKKKAIGARVGEWKRNSTIESSPHQERQVVDIEMHSDFSRANLFYDVAVLFMNSPFNLPAPNVGLICLPSSTQMVQAGTSCTVSGWGKITEDIKAPYQSVLQKVELPAVAHDSCQEKLRRALNSFKYMLHTSLMCAGGEEDHDACFGDGGSPLVCPVARSKTETRYVQNGIVVGGIGCGKNGVPGVYADVAKVRDWIDKVVQRRGYNTSTYTID